MTKTYTIPKEITGSGFEFVENGHQYYFDGQPMTGVTSVLKVIAKPALIQWAANMADEYIRANVAYAIPGEDGGYWAIKPNIIEEARTAHRRKKEDAGIKGTDVHSNVEGFIQDGIDNNKGFIFGQSDNEQVKKFINWANANKVKFLSTEKRVYSQTYWLAGTYDFLCEINGNKYVGDLKTSSGIYGREFFAQTAAYRMMLEEAGETGFKGSVVVRLGKDGSFEEMYSTDYEDDKKLFLACLEVYRTMGNFSPVELKSQL